MPVGNKLPGIINELDDTAYVGSKDTVGVLKYRNRRWLSLATDVLEGFCSVRVAVGQQLLPRTLAFVVADLLGMFAKLLVGSVAHLHGLGGGDNCSAVSHGHLGDRLEPGRVDDFPKREHSLTLVVVGDLARSS